MSKWEMVKLDDICVRKIQTISIEDEFIIDYIDISSVDNLEKKVISYQTLNSKEAPSRAKQILEKDDILVSTVRPNLNAVAINRIKSKNVIVGSTGYCVLRCISGVDVNYIFNFCKSKVFINQLVKVAKGASYPAVSNSEVRNSRIPLPPLETQKQIAKTLDTAAELLAMRKQQLAELDNLIKSTFYDLFGDPVTNEKGWSQCYINDVFDIIDGDRGVNYPKQEDFTDEGYCLFLNTGNVTKDGFNFDYVKYISVEKDKQLRKGKVERGDIILTTRGTVGNIVHYIDSIPYSVVRINSGMILLRSKNISITPVFFCKMFKGDEMTRELKSLLSGTAQPQLPITNMKKIKIILPPLPLQNQFATIVTKIEEQKALVKKAINETQHLFKSLMSEYFD